MKTVTINVYNVNELNESAKERAHYDYLSNGFEHHWIDESIESVKTFCELFNVNITRYELTTYGYSYIDTDVVNNNFRGFKLSDCLQDEYSLTGYCLDYGLLKTFNDTFKQTGDAKQAFNAAIKQAVKDIVSDMKYQESLEYFCEMAEANNWQYLENGDYYG